MRDYHLAVKLTPSGDTAALVPHMKILLSELSCALTMLKCPYESPSLRVGSKQYICAPPPKGKLPRNFNPISPGAHKIGRNKKLVKL